VYPFRPRAGWGFSIYKGIIMEIGKWILTLFGISFLISFISEKLRE